VGVTACFPVTQYQMTTKEGLPDMSKLRPFSAHARLGMLAFIPILLTACEPEVGSVKWCAMMEKKPKGEWSANAALDYARHCIIKNE
jgi:hypothetical protein